MDNNPIVERIIELVVDRQLHDILGDLEDDVFDVVQEDDGISWHFVGYGRQVVIDIVDFVQVVVVAGVGGKVYDQLGVVFCTLFGVSERSVVSNDQIILLIADCFDEFAVGSLIEHGELVHQVGLVDIAYFLFDIDLCNFALER